MTIGLWCVVVALAMPYFLTLAARSAYDRHVAISDPRSHDAKLTGWRRRAYLAHLNSFESATPFAIAVLVAEFAHAPRTYINILAIVILALRFLYVYFYLSDRGTWRSVAFQAGLLCNMALFAMSAWLGHIPA